MSDAPTSPESRLSRCFFAIFPDETLHDSLGGRLAQLQSRPWKNLVNWTAPEQWHLTLHFLPEVDQTQKDALAVAAAETLQHSKALTLTVGDVEFFPRISRARALAVHVTSSPELRDLRRKLQLALATTGVAADESKNFRAHITLGRLKQGFPHVNSLRLRRQPVPWLVDKIFLMESHLTAKGTDYKEIASFPLG